MCGVVYDRLKPPQTNLLHDIPELINARIHTFVSFCGWLIKITLDLESDIPDKIDKNSKGYNVACFATKISTDAYPETILFSHNPQYLFSKTSKVELRNWILTKKSTITKHNRFVKEEHWQKINQWFKPHTQSSNTIVLQV